MVTSIAHTPASEAAAQPAPPASSPGKPKLLDRMREALRSPHYRRRTEEHWVRQFIYYYLHFRNRAEMAEPEVNAFLTDSAVKRHVSATGYAIATVQELLGHHDVKPLEGSPCKLE